MEIPDENSLKKKLAEIEDRCLREEVDLIAKEAKVDEEMAYDLLMKYRNIWEFTGNVSTSGDSLIVTLPKKEARKRSIKKGTPVFVAMKKLRFYSFKK